MDKFIQLGEPSMWFHSHANGSIYQHTHLMGIRIAWLLGGTCVFLIGVAGNLLSLMVIFCRRYFVRNFSVFLVAHMFSNLAVMACLAEHTYEMWIEGEEYLYSNTSFILLCRLGHWAEGWASTFNSWLLVALTLIRLLSTISPSYRMRADKMAHNILILAAMIVISAMIQAPRIVLGQEKTEGTKLSCVYTNELIIVWVDLMFQCVIPGTTLVVSNILIGRTLYASTQRLKLYHYKMKKPSPSASKQSDPVSSPEDLDGGNSLAPRVDILNWSPSIKTTSTRSKGDSRSPSLTSLGIPRSPNLPSASQPKEEPDLRATESEEAQFREPRQRLQRSQSVAAATLDAIGRPVYRIRSASSSMSRNVLNYSTCLLLFLSFSFVVCNTPLFAYRAFKNPNEYDQNVELVFRLLFYFGHSITIYTYTFTGTRFRRACLSMLYQGISHCLFCLPECCRAYLESKAAEAQLTLSSSTKFSFNTGKRF